ncbi:MAG TPA: GAF and ANTAR domain-containing protein [Acidimicrobiales bacterium]|nr:GAF and ANTAR domain-containing protein [Acidimicrobiales bacterium]
MGVGDGRRLVEALAEIATLAAEPFDVELLHVAAERVCQVLAVDGVSILVSLDGAGLAWALPAIGVPGLEDVVLDADGPCQEVLRKGEAASFSIDDEDDERFPSFAARCRSLGVTAALAVPLRHRDRTIGVLLIARSGRRHFLSHTVADARRFADVIAAGLVREHAHRMQRAVNEQLQHALDARVVVEQAKGMIAADLNVGVDVALEKLRRFARSHQLKLHEVAADVVSRTLSAEILRAS